MKRIGITLGDPAGVGPEILVRCWRDGQLGGIIPVIYGERSALKKVEDELGWAVDCSLRSSATEAREGVLNWIDTGILSVGEIPTGEINAGCGAAALRAIDLAGEAALAGEIEAVTTLPVNKEACRMVDPDFQGHTERFAGMCGCEDFIMLFASPRMIVSLVTIHVSLRQAIESLTVERIVKTARLTAPEVLRLRGSANLVIPGLNPHAGEGGAFGREEIETIIPAVEQLKAEGYDVEGPFSPDTLFGKLLDGTYDAAVCLYHDQGLIPMKLDGFAEAVNITAGLPIVRTSVDHGTAFDIAYTGKASGENFLAAVTMAQLLAEN